jgi:hypothetical protein
MGNQEKLAMEKQTETESQLREKKSKKASKDPAATQPAAPLSETVEPKATVKITFDGEAAQKILKCESELRERLSKPDMGKILGNEILAWTDKRWAEIVEENTDIDYFFAQIRKCPDKSKSIKLLKALSEKLKSESPDGASAIGVGATMALSTAPTEEGQRDVG